MPDVRSPATEHEDPEQPRFQPHRHPNIKSFPAALKAKIASVAEKYGERMSPVRTELKNMLSDRHMIPVAEKDFETRNAKEAWRKPANLKEMISQRAKKKEQHIKHVLSKAEELSEKTSQTTQEMIEARR